MKSMKKDWYKKVWTMDIQNMSWVEDTKKEVDFLIAQLKLQGNERILDLACGYGVIQRFVWCQSTMFSVKLK